MRYLILVIGLSTVCVSVLLAQGQGGGGQNFGITTVPANQSITHNLNNANQSFPTEQWEVETAGANNGATFDIEADDFVNQSNNQFTRPTQLTLTLVSSTKGTWSVTTSTDDSTGGSTAIVSAESTSPSDDATFDLDSTFLEDTTPDTIAPNGTYQTTVTATLTAK